MPVFPRRVCLHLSLLLQKSRTSFYRITTQRIKLERGLLSKVQESLELFRIDHFELRKPLGSRLLGQASLHLYSSDAELENFSIYGVPHLEVSQMSCATASFANAPGAASLHSSRRKAAKLRPTDSARKSPNPYAKENREHHG